MTDRAHRGQGPASCEAAERDSGAGRRHGHGESLQPIHDEIYPRLSPVAAVITASPLQGAQAPDPVTGWAQPQLRSSGAPVSEQPGRQKQDGPNQGEQRLHD